ncbi:MAG: metalloregulator ArsR/SmtB family transcription factor [Acidobacteria bacterium]|nr:metalloregulator ArsR/SmtB family transcription factor [Acidobacteriota bacterium]
MPPSQPRAPSWWRLRCGTPERARLLPTTAQCSSSRFSPSRPKSRCPGSASGASHETGIAETASFLVEVAKSYGRGWRRFVDPAEFTNLVDRCGRCGGFRRSAAPSGAGATEAGTDGRGPTVDSRSCPSTINACRFIDMKEAASLYRILGDEARLRILRLLSAHRLNVSELTRILGIAQSGVSRHLGLLKDAGLVAEERDGGFAYYRAADAENNGCLSGVHHLLRDQFAAQGDVASRADEARLQEVLRVRRENFETRGDEHTQLVPGRSWAAWARALGHLLPPLRVADLGCGEGYLTIEAARWARDVIAVDRSDAVLRRARALARRRRASNIVWKRGEIEELPLDDGAVDVAMLSQALHHAEDPARAVAEAARVIVPLGRVLVLDLRAHAQGWVKTRLGDRWLGFDDDRLEALLAGAGLEDVRIGVGARHRGDPFTVLVASGRKPARRSRNTAERRGPTRTRLRAGSVSETSEPAPGKLALPAKLRGRSAKHPARRALRGARSGLFGRAPRGRLHG